MATSIDRFETKPRDNAKNITQGWRITRYSFGGCTIQHLRSGRRHSGVDDGFGNIVDAGSNAYNANIHMHHDEIVPFYL